MFPKEIFQSRKVNSDAAVWRDRGRPFQTLWPEKEKDAERLQSDSWNREKTSWPARLLWQHKLRQIDMGKVMNNRRTKYGGLEYFRDCSYVHRFHLECPFLPILRSVLFEMVYPFFLLYFPFINCLLLHHFLQKTLGELAASSKDPIFLFWIKNHSFSFSVHLYAPLLS